MADDARREQARAVIRQWMDEHGVVRGSGVKLWEQFPEVPKSTFLKWYDQEVKARKKGPRQITRREAEKANAKAAEIRRKRRKRGTVAKEKAVAAAEAVLPEVVSPETVNPLASGSVIEQVRECVGHAETVLAYCRREDGSIRNPTLFLRASGHMLAAIETLTKVAERLHDAQRIEQVHDAIFREIRRASPEVAQRILEQVRDLQVGWGLR